MGATDWSSPWWTREATRQWIQTVEISLLLRRRLARRDIEAWISRHPDATDEQILEAYHAMRLRHGIPWTYEDT
jgi:hypothetical protein